ncbi:MAG: hypothetical protein BRC22_01005, partial [Parcubacteria group bacterium QH_9_35_7]
MNKSSSISITLVLIGLISGGVFLSYKKNFNNNNKKQANETTELKEGVKITDGVKHTAPLDEIMSGGPPKDGIPSIDNPKFVATQEANFLSEDTPGIAVSLKEVDRFYPYSILVWHEIVNDKIDGDRILVTYCPLCRSGVVYDPVVKGEEVEFGVSG